MAESTPKKKFDDAELKERLDALQYQVTQHAGTERAFSGVYWDCHDEGTYRCVVCDEPLFDSETKFESGSGWPSFWQPLSSEAVEEHTDRSHGMSRTEVVCRSCGAHLGHVFPDGPPPSGLRYCMNAVSLEKVIDRLDQVNVRPGEDVEPAHAAAQGVIMEGVRGRDRLLEWLRSHQPSITMHIP